MKFNIKLYLQTIQYSFLKSEGTPGRLSPKRFFFVLFFLYFIPSGSSASGQLVYWTTFFILITRLRRLENRFLLLEISDQEPHSFIAY